VTPVRGRVYMADLGPRVGLTPFVVVSNNGRNRHLPTCLGVRITTSAKPKLHTIIEMGKGDPLVGRALCDDIEILDVNELVQDLGALSAETMMRVGQGLRHALALA
jgi:mRNA interferase MazF